MKRTILFKVKRYWDFLTLGKFKWYFFLGYAIGWVLSSIIALMRDVTHGVYKRLYGLSQGEYFSGEGLDLHLIFIKFYQNWNPVLYWNYVWVKSEAYDILSLPLCICLFGAMLIAYLRGE